MNEFSKKSDYAKVAVYHVFARENTESLIFRILNCYAVVALRCVGFLLRCRSTQRCRILATLS